MPQGRTSPSTAAFKSARDFLLKNRERYEYAYANFSWPKLDRFNWALDWFDALGSGPGGDRIALWIVNEDDSETRVTFKQLATRSSRVANYLRKLGLRRGDRILVMLGNVPALWETTLAAMKLGAVIIPTTTQLTAEDISDRLQRGQVRCILSAPEHRMKFEGLGGNFIKLCFRGAGSGWQSYDDSYTESSEFIPDGDTGPSDPFQLYFTSGTTNKPKLVLHSHASYPVGHLSTMYWLGLQPTDIHCNLSSPGWAKHAWSSLFAPWNAEATVLVVNQSRFNGRNLLDTLVRCRVTSFCAPPTVWRLLVQESLAEWKTHLHSLASAGEPLNPEVIDRVFDAWGLMIRDGYGQTETTAQIGNPPGEDIKIGSMGRPLPGYQVVLYDVDGKESDEGELCLKLDPRPLGLMPAYLDDNGSLEPIEGGVYRTGDVAFRDVDGYYTFVGRADDVFKSSDYRLSPFEIESALIKHPDVVECAVVPAPDALRLSVPKAFIVLRPGADPSKQTALSIFRHVFSVLAPYKRVRRIEFYDLPKTVSGKIRRVELRQLETARSQDTARPRLEFREDDFPELRTTAAPPHGATKPSGGETKARRSRD